MILIASVMTLVLPLVTSAAVPYLVKDINVYTQDSNPHTMIEINGTIYFAADDGYHGTELWKSNTTDGTVLVRDIATGPNGSNVQNLIRYNNQLYFSANDGVNGTQLWTSDGTPQGTVMVKAINPTGGSGPGNFAVSNGILFFTADDGSNGTELWRSDGTTGNTYMVKDISSGGGGSDPLHLTNVGNVLYFVAATDGFSYELWRSDGTELNTYMVKKIYQGSSYSDPSWLTDFNGTLFFSADDGVNGYELWMSDGTAGGTQIVKDIRPGIGNSYPIFLTVMNGILYFQARDGSNGYELWRSDGTLTGTQIVRDICGSSCSSNPSNLLNVGGTLFFAANNGTNGTELWKSDGTGPGTSMIEIVPGSGSPSPSNLTDVNGTLFFTADDGIHGEELWKSDGITAAMVKDIWQGIDNSRISGMQNAGGVLYFQADDGIHGLELWASNGTPAGTMMVTDINTSGTSIWYGLTKVGATLFFPADDGVTGTELWKSDGTDIGTKMVKDIYTGAWNSSDPQYMTNVAGTLLFWALEPLTGYELWKSNGTTAGTGMVKDINPTPNIGSGPTETVSMNGILFFDGSDGSNGVELWRSDGTDAGTVMVKDINPNGGSYPSRLTNVNGTLFFTADDGVHGYELWKSNGTAAGTVMVKDYTPDIPNEYPYNRSYFGGLINVGGTLFYILDNNNNGFELWKSNGTDPGTGAVSGQVFPYSQPMPTNLTDVNGTLYFTADDGTSGTELWKSDGTNVTLVKDICSPSCSSNPSNLVNVNGTLFFEIYSQGNYNELWKSNGTEIGTVLVKTFDPNSPNETSNLTNVNGTLHFTADDGVAGPELWMSDGTDAGTTMVSDIFPGPLGSAPCCLTKVYNKLFFIATDDLHGTELWALDLVKTDTTPPQTTASVPTGTYNTVLTVELNCNDGVGGVGCEDVFYTLDGNDPTLASRIYTGPIQISATTSLKFFGVDGAGNAEGINILVYTINPVLPSVAITIPQNNSIRSFLLSVDGTASAGDPLWGLDRVEFQMSFFDINAGETRYLLSGGQGWSSTEQWLPVTGSTVWSYGTSGVPQWSDYTWYTISARAYDMYGNFSTATSRFFRQQPTQVPTDLTLYLSSQAIKSGDTVTLSGKLTRLPDVGVDMTGKTIKFTITPPSGPNITPEPTTTTDSLGRYALNVVSGLASEGIYTIKAHFDGDTFLASSQSMTKPVVVGALSGYAIIVEGKIPNGEGQSSHNKTANRVYDSLKARNFTDENIYYFNYQSTGQPTGILVDASPTKSAVQAAIETWAKDKMVLVPAPLYIILIDHGNPDTFYIDTETITPTDLNTWLTSLETSLAGLQNQPLKKKRVIVIGTCYSGSFIPLLSKAGSLTDGGRVIITSAAANEESYRGPQESDNIRSGEFFIDQLFQSLTRGFSFRDSFVLATGKAEAYTLKDTDAQPRFSPVYQDVSGQHPLLDDNGDGRGSNVLSSSSLIAVGNGDGQVADTVYLGTGVTNTTVSPADFTSVTPTVFIPSGLNTTTLWGRAGDINAITKAWIDIRYLGNALSGGASSGQIDLVTTRADMAKNTTTGQWEAGVTQFENVGVYVAYYFTERLLAQGRTEVSLLNYSIIYKKQASNQPPAGFSLASPADNDTVKTALLLTWNPSSDTDTPLTYTLEITTNADVGFLSPVYVAEGLSSTAAIIGTDAGLEDLTSYRWRVSAIDRFGEVTTTTAWRFSTNNTNALPAFITGAVTDSSTGAALTGASITASLGSVNTASLSPTGEYFMSIGSGTTNLSITLGGYNNATVPDFYVSPGEEVIKNITLTSTVTPYTLTVSKNPASTGTGSVTGSGSYPGGTQATATATAGSDANFTGWGSDCSSFGTASPISITMSSDKNCSAMFTLKTYTLTVNTAGTGSGSVSGGGTFNHGTNPSVTASANWGSTFTGWSGDCSGSSSATSVYMNGTKTCTATFTLNQYTMTINKAGTGNGTVSGAGTYNYGQYASVSASPDPNSTFGGWGGDCIALGSSTSGNIYMDNTKTCSATFIPKSYTLTLQVSGAGTGIVTGAGTYTAGTNANVTANPDATSLFSSWGGDCSGGASTSVLMNGNKSCTALFILNPTPPASPARRMPSETTYASLQSALDGVTSDNETVQHMSGKYSIGMVSYTKTNPLSLKGGYNTGFTTNSGTYTTISGSLTLQGGAVIVENLGIQ